MKLASLMISSTMLATSLLAGVHHAHWGYTGHEDPTHWGDLNPKYAECKLGGSQSPININKDIIVETKGLAPIDFHYTSGAAEVINNGHSVQVNIKPGSFIKVDGKEFELKQFHFHTPSENQIDGKNFPLEAHFVHQAKDGSLAVVAVMFENGKENEIINKIWKKMPHEAGKKVACGLSAEMINELLPKEKAYYRFDGSLTTPPCSEGVRWFVLKDYSEVSKDEVNEFLHTLHHPNNRPVQPVNARKVLQ
ncbi:carbonic anhydrase [Sulfurimonas paralvinellae]|uniref:Carbonic anhydrase n=1 Tax=Sulfurimonas paralvinellae TaxID=317658 RepID=A0A7M1B873_9BACT|nr:carbonic anhydrase family protein [Sulfurimonas paralvinellae]QOP45939.1 carbonic anhydrase family protein [Sulfurimonas paralvinellae]